MYRFLLSRVLSDLPWPEDEDLFSPEARDFILRMLTQDPEKRLGAHGTRQQYTGGRGLWLCRLHTGDVEAVPATTWDVCYVRVTVFLTSSLGVYRSGRGESAPVLCAH